MSRGSALWPFIVRFGAGLRGAFSCRAAEGCGCSEWKDGYVYPVLHEVVPVRAGSLLGLQVLILQMADAPVFEELTETHVGKDIAASRELLLDPVFLQQADKCELLQYFFRVRSQRLLQQCVTL